MKTGATVILTAAATVVCLVGSTAFAQVQSTAQQKCLNTLNTDSRKMAVKQGKESVACVKAATKSTAFPDCLRRDLNGKVSGLQTKALADELDLACLDLNRPDFGAGSAFDGTNAARDSEVNLFADVYGSFDPTAVISTAPLEGGCQSKVTKRLERLIAAKWKQYVACKKAALKNGASGAAALEACLQGDPSSVAADPRGKIGKAFGKLQADVGTACSAVSVATTFPGTCSGETVGGLAACLDVRAECRLCKALNTIDGLSVDCDSFDDGLANGSCGMAQHLCVLGAGSDMKIYVAALVSPITVSLVGSSIEFGVDGVVSTCTVQSFVPFNIVGIGLVCMSPGGACPNGSRFCGPSAPGLGPSQGVYVQSDSTIGACTGNADCAGACDAYCGNGIPFQQLASGCTDYCNGMAPADMVCTSDAQCATAGNGACNGQDNAFASNANVCQCSCVSYSSGGSDPGDLRCNLGAYLRIEASAPCDAADVVVDLGAQHAARRGEDGRYQLHPRRHRAAALWIVSGRRLQYRLR